MLVFLNTKEEVHCSPFLLPNLWTIKQKEMISPLFFLSLSLSLHFFLFSSLAFLFFFSNCYYFSSFKDDAIVLT